MDRQMMVMEFRGRTAGGRASCRDQLVVQQKGEETWAGRNREAVIFYFIVLFY